MTRERMTSDHWIVQQGQGAQMDYLLGVFRDACSIEDYDKAQTGLSLLIDCAQKSKLWLDQPDLGSHDYIEAVLDCE